LKHNILTAVFLTAFVLSSVIFWETGYGWIVLSAIAGIYFLITAYGAFKIQANYFVKSINSGAKKSVALTFDDGPDPEFTPRILDILREKNVDATFFVIGKKAEKYPELLRQIIDEGHEIGNHSYSHHYLIAFFSTLKLVKDLSRCNEIIFQAIGNTPRFFRPPFGVTNPRYPAALKENNLLSIGWSLRSLDTRTNNKNRLVKKVISNLKTGDIVLLHDNLAVTAHALDEIIEQIIDLGIIIQPLSKVINKPPYV